MDRLTRCPLCDGSDLETIAARTFARPERPAEAYLGDPTANYVPIRLCVLFDRILSGEMSLEVTTDLCGACGFVFSNPVFTTDEMRVKYETLGELVPTDVATRPRVGALRKRAERVHRLVAPHAVVRADRPLRVLDFGGSTGRNLVPFVAAGHRGFVVDYETCELPAGVAHLGPAIPEGERFDVILACHVLEHVPRPLSMFRTLESALADDGVLYVEVPLGVFRECRALPEPLTHVNFFSEQSLHAALGTVGLGTRHLETAYQFVVAGRTLCLNAIGRKGATATVAAPRSARSQMGSRFLLDPKRLLTRPHDYVHWFGTRLTSFVRRRLGV